MRALKGREIIDDDTDRHDCVALGLGDFSIVTLTLVHEKIFDYKALGEKGTHLMAERKNAKYAVFNCPAPQ